MVPLPALIVDKDDDDANGRPSFAFALPAVVESLSSRLSSISLGPAAAEPKGPPPNHADSYGLRQVVVATTQPGKLFGLHSSDGSILWSRRLRSSVAGGAPPRTPYLFTCRGGGGAQAIVVSEEGEGAAASWALHVMVAASGKLLSPAGKGALSGAGRVLHAAKLGGVSPPDGSMRTPVMIVDEALRVHLHPAGDETMRLVRQRLGDLFFYVHSKASGALTGYALAYDDKSRQLRAVKRWSLALPADAKGRAGRSAVTLAAYPADAAVHSPVRVLGNRDVLHKYINRNLLAVGIEVRATASTSPSSPSPSLHPLWPAASTPPRPRRRTSQPRPLAPPPHPGRRRGRV